ncbi:MAG: hypothetical protein ACPG4T_17955 [Nannocystaceae bacterium]
MSRADKVALFQTAMMWSGSAFVIGALFGFAVGLTLQDDRRAHE